MKKIFDEIYSDGKNIYTKSSVKERVYGEKIINVDNDFFRQWNPFKSKYCAGLTNKLCENVFKKDSVILYLGSAEGTTVSHVSDIASEGIIFCIDLSEIAMQKLTKLAEKRENIFPILSDANKIEKYTEFIDKESCDVLFQDVSQRNQAEIFVKNAYFLKKGGYGVLSLKTKSISQKNKKEILDDEKKKLEEVFTIEQIVSIEPF